MMTATRLPEQDSSRYERQRPGCSDEASGFYFILFAMFSASAGVAFNILSAISGEEVAAAARLAAACNKFFPTAFASHPDPDSPTMNAAPIVESVIGSPDVPIRAWLDYPYSTHEMTAATAPVSMFPRNPGCQIRPLSSFSMN